MFVICKYGGNLCLQPIIINEMSCARLFKISVFIAFFLTKVNNVLAQQDTLNIMVYNVLHFGDGCQGSNSFLLTQLKDIVNYTNPDVIGMVKTAAIAVTPTDHNGILPYGYADTIIKYALDADFPNRYNYGALTNISGSNDMDVLFYNQNKLGFLKARNLISIQEDFDLYKLYYKDPFLATTHDTTFLYFVLNHTVSGSSSTQRDQQDTLIINQLESIFYHLPNLISMGDFNTRSSGETGYLKYVTNRDTNYLFYDPPFNPDHNLTYPIDWDQNPSLCVGYLNTSTRLQSSYPNSCGANGGAKDWYGHEFISSWLAHNTDYMKYVPNSYTTFGNDGHRLGISENDSTTNGRNNSAPSCIVNAIFQFSDKYPVMIKLAVTYDSLGNGPINPVNALSEVSREKEKITVTNPIQEEIKINFSPGLLGSKCMMWCYDIYGRTLFEQNFTINGTSLNRPVNFASGSYILRLQTMDRIYVFHLVK
jgi:hypothetical protein